MKNTLWENKELNVRFIFSIALALTLSIGLVATLLARQPVKISVVISFTAFYSLLIFSFILIQAVLIGESLKIAFLELIPFFIFWLIAPSPGYFAGPITASLDIPILNISGAFFNLFFHQSFNTNVMMGIQISAILTSVYLSGIVWMKSRCISASLLSLLVSFILNFFIILIVPYLSFSIFFPETIDIKSIDKYSLARFNFVNNYFYLIILFFLYFLLKLSFAGHLLKRVNHILPVFFICIAGSVLSNAVHVNLILVVFSVIIACFATLSQNDYFDRNEDDPRRRGYNITHSDVDFLNIIFFLVTIFLFFLGINSAIPLILFFAVSILYNYPFYRGKKRFPSNMKIEGIWGGTAFLSGAMTDLHNNEYHTIALTAFLVFCGWSAVSALKDIKDVRADVKSGNSNLLIFLNNNGISLSNSHKIILLFSLLCLSIPPVYFLMSGGEFLGISLIVSVIFPLYLLFRKFPNSRWFQFVLILLSLYFVEIIIERFFFN